MANMMIIRDDGVVVRDSTADEVARASLDERQLVWIDLDQPPTPEDVQIVMRLPGIGESAVEHITQPHKGSRAVGFRSYLLVVIYDIGLVPDGPGIEKDELVLLLGDRYLVTVHGGKTRRLAEVADHLDPALGRFGITVGAVVFGIIDAVVDRYLEVLDVVRRRVDSLEERVLNQDEPEAITELYHLRRELTDLRRVIAPEESLIGARSTPNPAFSDPDLQDAMLDVKHNMQRAVDEIDQYLGMLPDILTTFEALKSDNLNRIVKLLTVWSIILTAVALFPTVLGISLSREPSISPYVGYVVSIAAMVIVGGAIWYIFRRHGWTD